MGRKPANGWGLHDMSGNVWEWTCSESQDRYDGSEQECAAQVSLYSLRGGSWNFKPRRVRAAYRDNYYPDTRSYLIGFRLARD